MRSVTVIVAIFRYCVNPRARRKAHKNELSPQTDACHIASSKRCRNRCPSGIIRGERKRRITITPVQITAIRIAQMRTSYLDLQFLHERAGSSDPLTKRRTSYANADRFARDPRKSSQQRNAVGRRPANSASDARMKRIKRVRCGASATPNGRRLSLRGCID